MPAVEKVHGLLLESVSSRSFMICTMYARGLTSYLHRLAQDLGLHRLDRHTDETAESYLYDYLWDMESKRRLWAKLVSWDR